MTVSVEALESASYSMWSPDEEAEIDGWIARACGGFTRRLNSATGTAAATGGPATHDRLSAWFRDRGLPPALRVTPMMDDGLTDRVAADWGSVPSGRTLVMVTDSLPTGEVAGADVVEPDTPGFLERLIDLNGRPRAHLANYRRVIARLGGSCMGVAVGTSAVGLVAVSGNLSSVYSVAVAPEARRTGRATAIMRRAAAWAAESGAESQVIQVLESNLPAVDLYRGLGFGVAYRYAYLEPDGAFDRDD